MRARRKLRPLALCDLLLSHLLITLLIIQKREMSELCAVEKRLDVTLMACLYSGVRECSSGVWCCVPGLADQCLMVLMIKN